MPNFLVPLRTALNLPFAALRRAHNSAASSFRAVNAAINLRRQVICDFFRQQCAAQQAVPAPTSPRKRRLDISEQPTLEDRPAKRRSPSPAPSNVSSSVISTPRSLRQAWSTLYNHDPLLPGWEPIRKLDPPGVRRRRAEKRERHKASGRYWNPERGRFPPKEHYPYTDEQLDEIYLLASHTDDAKIRKKLKMEKAAIDEDRKRSAREELEARKREREVAKAEAVEEENQRKLQAAKDDRLKKERQSLKKKRKAAEYKAREQERLNREFVAYYEDAFKDINKDLDRFRISDRDETDDRLRALREKYGKVPKRAEKKRILTPLSDEWEDRVKTALAVRSETSVMGKSVEGVELSRRDIGKVLPGEPWLNDEVVNAWYANLCARLNEKDGYVKGPNNVPRWVAYSTAWYKNATEKGINSIAGWSRRKGVKGDKVLRAERIFFPTNSGAHWTLLTISGTRKTIEYLDSMNTTGFRLAKYISLAKAWLKMELGEKYVEDEWEVLHSFSAQQENTNDCGVFACLNGWALAKGSEDLSKEFAAKDIPLARRMLVATLLNGGFTGDFDL